MRNDNWAMSFLRASAIRAIRTVAQSAAAAIGTAAVTIHEVDWGIVASTALLAGVLSLLTSVATGLPEVSNDEETP